MKKIVLIVSLSLISFILIGFIFLYNSKYFIILNGKENITINLNEKYKELGAKTLLKTKIKIKGTVDNTKVGKYSIKYYHNKKYKERIVKVVDNIEPVITLNGNAEINIVLNGQYIELGATVIDNYDKNLEVKIINNLDITKVGEYKIIYEATDSSGNKTQVDRIINVNEKGPLSLSMKEFNLNGYFENTILKETEDKGYKYLEDTIFYGDSITFNFFYYGQLSQNNVWAMSSLTPETAHLWNVPFYKYNTEIKFVDGIKKYKPKRVIITLGANAVAVMTKDYFIQKYEELIVKAKEANPDTVFIVQSIFPVDNRFNNSKSLNNVKINNFNYYLAEMCERQKIYFLNTQEILKDSEGYLKKNYCYASDGIHLLPSGNKVIMDYIRKHGVEE